MNGSPEYPTCEGAQPANPIISTEQGSPHVREIPLTQGKVALIDAEDFEKVSAIRWHAENRGCTCYAAHSYRDRGKVMKLPMQRVVLGDAPRGMVIDHIDGNGLDNRKCNLRFVTVRHNTANIPNRKKKSKYMGVSWNSQQGKWVVKPLINGKVKQLGCFVNEADAARRYQDFLDQEGAVSRSNFPRKRGQTDSA